MTPCSKHKSNTTPLPAYFKPIEEDPQPMTADRKFLGMFKNLIESMSDTARQIKQTPRCEKSQNKRKPPMIREPINPKSSMFSR